MFEERARWPRVDGRDAGRGLEPDRLRPVRLRGGHGRQDSPRRARSGQPRAAMATAASDRHQRAVGGERDLRGAGDARAVPEQRHRKRGDDRHQQTDRERRRHRRGRSSLAGSRSPPRSAAPSSVARRRASRICIAIVHVRQKETVPPTPWRERIGVAPRARTRRAPTAGANGHPREVAVEQERRAKAGPRAGEAGTR